jgi:hypothetical protein
VRDARKQVLGLLLSGLEVIFHQHVAADGLHRQQRTQTNVITLHTTNFLDLALERHEPAPRSNKRCAS